MCDDIKQGDRNLEYNKEHQDKINLFIKNFGIDGQIIQECSIESLFASIYCYPNYFLTGYRLELFNCDEFVSLIAYINKVLDIS